MIRFRVEFGLGYGPDGISHRGTSVELLPCCGRCWCGTAGSG